MCKFLSGVERGVPLEWFVGLWYWGGVNANVSCSWTGGVGVTYVVTSYRALYSTKLTIFALRALVNSEQFLWVCWTLSHYIHLYWHGRSEFETSAGPGAHDCCEGCPSKNSMSFEICLVSSSMESDAAGAGLTSLVTMLTLISLEKSQSKQGCN